MYITQVQGQIKLISGGVLSFGLAHYSLSEFEVLAEELLMSDSVIKVSIRSPFGIEVALPLGDF